MKEVGIQYLVRKKKDGGEKIGGLNENLKSSKEKIKGKKQQVKKGETKGKQLKENKLVSQNYNPCQFI